MTTPSQPDDDLKVESEAVEDLDVTNEDADDIGGGVFAGGRAFGIPSPTRLNTIRSTNPLN